MLLLRTKGEQIPPTGPCPAVQGQQSDNVLVDALCTRIRMGRMCEDCLAHRVSFRSKRNCSVPRVELQIEGQLVCTRIYIRKFRVLPFCSVSAKSKFRIFVVSEDILNSNFHSPDLYRRTDNSSCQQKSATRRTDCLGTLRLLSLGENKASRPASLQENKVFRSLSWYENIYVFSVWFRDGDLHATVMSRIPGHWSVLRVISRVCRQSASAQVLA